MPDQDDLIEQRKAEHISLSLDTGSQHTSNVFAKYRLPYRALPELNLDDVDTSTEFLGHTLSQPLIISSMTGGTAHALDINRNLAIAAEKCGVAIGVGSQRIALEKEEAKASFMVVREYAPNAVIIANMGAIQLNNGRGIDDFREVVDMIQANALYLHLNPLQEALQPEGDTNYAALLPKIKKLVRNIGVPVFVKEVGHGIDAQTAKELLALGVAGIDVAGVGGTSYAWIEAKRAKNANFADWFKDFGIPSDQAISQIYHLNKKSTIVASGGVRSPLDGLKAGVLGADLYAAATPFLEAALQKDPEALLKQLNDWQRGLQVAMFSCGIDSWSKRRQLTLTLDAS